MELSAPSKIKTGSYNQKQTENARFRRVCLVCKAEFIYRPAGKDKGKEEKRGLCCSMECKKAHIRNQRPGPYSPLFIGTCRTCNGSIAARNRKVYCSDACLPKVEYIGPTTQHMTATRKCNVCETEFEYTRGMGRPPGHCSDECKAAVATRCRRVAKGRRKARMKEVEYESVDPIKLCERDGWKCQICGIDTPKELRGTYRSNAPEVDHIIPVSKGGPHTYANTQCACKECNMLKSDNITS